MWELMQLSDAELGINFFTDRHHVGRCCCSESMDWKNIWPCTVYCTSQMSEIFRM